MIKNGKFSKKKLYGLNGSYNAVINKSIIPYNF